MAIGKYTQGIRRAIFILGEGITTGNTNGLGICANLSIPIIRGIGDQGTPRNRNHYKRAEF
jgi:hypothetical protein